MYIARSEVCCASCRYIHVTKVPPSPQPITLIRSIALHAFPMRETRNAWDEVILALTTPSPTVVFLKHHKVAFRYHASVG